MKLISMTDFVLEQKIQSYEPEHILKRITNYANFLKQPLKLEMFVPCDEDGNVLEVPNSDNEINNYFDLSFEYHQAKERVLFKGFNTKYFKNFDGLTIEYLVTLNVTLTESAKKQIF